jgi:hypothetical protein
LSTVFPNQAVRSVLLDGQFGGNLVETLNMRELREGHLNLL